MTSRRLFFELVSITESIGCPRSNCENEAVVRFGVNANPARYPVCLPHAVVVLERWIKREQSREQTERLRAEIAALGSEEEKMKFIERLIAARS